jgi:hypothetical protein
VSGYCRDANQAHWEARILSIATGTDRVLKYAFKATGAKLSSLFDGSEQLISITSVPFFSRQIFLPAEVTQ